MVDTELFYNLLKNNNISHFIGVPDSLLKNFCQLLDDKVSNNQHIITANEGLAISLATGIYLGQKKISLVYMQNSGLGNAINPLVSLTHSKVYSIPMLLLIGWRGEPGIRDEPQHMKQGSISEEILNSLDIPYYILDKNSNINEIALNAFNCIERLQTPVALLVKKETFTDYSSNIPVQEKNYPSREEVLNKILSCHDENTYIIATTGVTARELYRYREIMKQKHNHDFLSVGSMGHASSIALGIAMSKPDKKILCIDGDGSTLMHMGALPINGVYSGSNFTHILLNNYCHDSVGGQPTVGDKINFAEIARSCGYKNVITIKNINEIDKSMKIINTQTGSKFIEILIRKGFDKNLERPKEEPIINRNYFMESLND